ncbi:MAG: NAD-binding protein [Candidatus Thermoplasmatota archaeon]|nr:NAD-binding protein [Candidatus Thermoplasmatota archaeon]
MKIHGGKLKNRVVFFSLALFTVFIVGVAGYCFIKATYENGSISIIDGVYWTVVTMTTLGSYPQGVELTSKAGKIFTGVIVSMGITIVFVGLPLTIAPWFEERMKQAILPEKIPVPDENHVIICGYSETGKEVVKNIKTYDIGYVIVENDDLFMNKLSGTPHVYGDPTSEETLKKANISNASSLIAVKDDATNAFVCLTAKKMRPEIMIVASADDISNTRILLKAGATKVVSSKSMAGGLLGQRAVGRYDVDITGRITMLGGLEIHQHTIPENSLFVGKNLEEAGIGEKSGVAIVGMWKNGKLTVNPKSDEKIREGTILVVMGTKEQLSKLRGMI